MSIGKIDSPLMDENDEKLGVGEHIDALTEFICQCETPMTIAIQGDWGTGKTSMMQIVEKKLKKLNKEGKGNYGIVKFNTWQFSQFDLQDDVPIVLLMEMLKAFGYQESKAKKFLVGSVKKAGGVLGAIFGGAEGREAMKQLLEADPTNMITQIKELKNDMEKAVNEKREKEKVDRIVVFIDDLDRMNPGKAVELLEIIKNFLDIEGCVYVLAVDYGVVSRGVRQKYGRDMDEVKGRSFFDKIIQLPFNLPVAQYEIESYLKDLFELKDEEARIYKKLAQTSVGTNPRALKRMANTLKLIELVAEKKQQFDKDNETEFRRALFASLCLQMAFESVYSQILGSGEYMDFLQNLVDNEAEVMEKFREAIQKLPGKPEIAEKRLKVFFKVLDDSMPMIGDEKNYDLFDSVMRLSGVTASGAQSAEEKEIQKNSFDPKLMVQLKSICSEIEKTYSSFWTMIDDNPWHGGDEGNEIQLPLTWGEWAGCVYIYNLNKDAIDRYVYSDAEVGLRKEYRDFLDKKISGLFPDMSKSKGNSKTLFKLPRIDWKAESAIKSIEATKERYEQVKHILNKDCKSLIPAMESVLKPSAMALDQIHVFLTKIQKTLLPLFSADDWKIEIQKKGNILYDGWEILTIRKSEWQDGVFIYLASDAGNGQDMNFSFYYGDLTPKKKDLKTVLSIFSEKRESLSLDEVTQSEGCAVINRLPKDVANWLEGSIFDDNLRFILNSEQQSTIISILQKCSEEFLSIEETLDAIAENLTNNK